MHYFTHTFPNGLRLIHLPSDSPVSYCGYAVHAGTRDEEAHEHGLAHFVEHLLFKGTARRKARHILNRMENAGGELNAYTTKEDTFVYSIFLEEHFGRASELLTDIVFHSCFPPREVVKEADVILDEINTYKDSPSELIFDDFEDLLFSGHPLGHNILGDASSLAGFTSEAGLSFARRFYTPAKAVFFSMGSTKPERILRLAGKHLGEEVLASTPPPLRTPPPLLSPQHKRIRRDTHQAHVITGGRAYGMYENAQKRMALFLVNNLLGGPGMNSRLNLSLREQHGLVYNVESNLTTYTDSGLASIYFGTDPRHTDRALRLVLMELKQVCNTRLSDARLTALKKQTSGQLGILGDNKENTFLTLGKQFLHRGSYEGLAEVFKKIDAVTSGEMLEVANEVFAPATLSSLIYT
ncbi:MAG: insulinase family protein [Tannerellaceae bacterium]|jgi:predicted Zn-dependent peptidase|nr:insulinase family protein [Tannerellaceae bacterium]